MRIIGCLLTAIYSLHITKCTKLIISIRTFTQITLQNKENGIPRHLKTHSAKLIDAIKTISGEH